MAQIEVSLLKAADVADLCRMSEIAYVDYTADNEGKGSPPKPWPNGWHFVARREPDHGWALRMDLWQNEARQLRFLAVRGSTQNAALWVSNILMGLRNQLPLQFGPLSKDFEQYESWTQQAQQRHFAAEQARLGLVVPPHKQGRVTRRSDDSTFMGATTLPEWQSAGRDSPSAVSSLAAAAAALGVGLPRSSIGGVRQQSSHVKMAKVADNSSPSSNASRGSASTADSEQRAVEALRGLVMQGVMACSVCAVGGAASGAGTSHGAGSSAASSSKARSGKELATPYKPPPDSTVMLAIVLSGMHATAAAVQQSPEDDQLVRILHTASEGANVAVQQAASDLQRDVNLLRDVRDEKPAGTTGSSRLLSRAAREYHVVLGGHSLGGCLAELLAVEQNLVAVTFESTGIKELITHINKRTRTRQEAVAEHRIVSFLAAPNIVNTLFTHTGAAFRIYMPWVDDVAVGDAGTSGAAAPATGTTIATASATPAAAAPATGTTCAAAAATPAAAAAKTGTSAAAAPAIAATTAAAAIETARAVTPIHTTAKRRQAGGHAAGEGAASTASSFINAGGADDGQAWEALHRVSLQQHKISRMLKYGFTDNSVEWPHGRPGAPESARKTRGRVDKWPCNPGFWRHMISIVGAVRNGQPQHTNRQWEELLRGMDGYQVTMCDDTAVTDALKKAQQPAPA